MSTPYISVVSPVYKAKEIVPELVRRIVASVSQITEDFELILVEEGCPENSFSVIEKTCENYHWINEVNQVVT
jgi:dolichol-phosphate mannosyltransferase